MITPLFLAMRPPPMVLYTLWYDTTYAQELYPRPAHEALSSFDVRLRRVDHCY